MTSFKKPAIAVFIAVTGALFAGYASAQADSTSGNRALQGRPIVLLQNQERETPVINNTTVQQITQVVQPNTYQASGYGSGYNAAAAYADCGGGTLLGGGGSCSNGVGLVAVATSQPSGNGWYLVCGAGFQDGIVDATAYAVCSAR